MARPGLGLRLGRRFNGPPGAANGGYACGAFAALLGQDGAAEVTLRRPIPLERSLVARSDGDGGLVVDDGGTLLAEVRPPVAGVELAAPAVSLEQARAVAGRSRYYEDPLLPGCFGCGPARAPGDGLRIFPGRLAGEELWAAPWTPDPSVAGADGTVRPEVVWAALDCPSGIAAIEVAALPGDTAAVLGRMTTRLGGPPRAGDGCRVVAWPGGRDGRKLAATAALLGPGGEVLAAASTVWVTVPRQMLETSPGAAS